MGDIPRGKEHARDHARTEDDGLSGVQEPKRGVGTNRCLLVARHGRVEAPRFQILVAEILHGLKVEQTINGFGVRLRIALIHVPANSDALLGREEGEPNVADDRSEKNADIDPTEVPGDKRRDHHEFHSGRDHIQDRHAKYNIDAVHTAFDDTV